LSFAAFLFFAQFSPTLSHLKVSKKRRRLANDGNLLLIFVLAN